jgi:hypothetical protein
VLFLVAFSGRICSNSILFAFTQEALKYPP